MKIAIHFPEKGWHAATGVVSCVVVLLHMLLFSAGHPAHAQQKHLVQVKTFDQQLKPYTDIDISVNDKDYISMGNKGVAFIELYDSELPLKSVKIKNDQLEAASWNYTKGVVEIIIRKKSYQLVQINVKDPDNKPLPGLTVTFKGKKSITSITDREGKFEILLALDEKITGANQFSIKEHNITDLILSDKGSVLIAAVIKPTPVVELQEIKPEIKSSYFRDFDLSKVDSIQSLTAYYAIFKNYSVAELNDDIKRKLDEKLNELVQQLQDSVTREEAFVGKISDSSFVADDIKNLLAQATKENKMLDGQRQDFDEKIRIINEKLLAENLDEGTRNLLLSDLSLLERMLEANEDKFYKNQSDYRSILNSLKEKFFHITALENKLSESEAQRLEDQEMFRKRILTISSVVVFFALLIILLIYFSNKLKKQKKQLVVANGEVKRINENLESLVYERTKLLHEVNRELDIFLYRASHDLRSPVCSIIGLCNIAAQVPSSELEGILNKTASTASAMDRLLKKLRIISEINHPTDFSSVALFSLVNEIRYSFNSFIDEHRISFTIDCPEDLSFNTNVSLIEAMLVNLIENALFYCSLKTAAAHEVQFRARIQGDHLEFSIYDNGIGIEPGIRQKLFDMFYKGHEKSKGNGLGLYIVQKSVTALKGSITLDSQAHGYTRFTVRIPAQTAVAESEMIRIGAGGVDIAALAISPA
jgi:signal transduction histidine kinase